MANLNKLGKTLVLVGLSALMLANVGCKKSSNDNSLQITARSARGGGIAMPNGTVNPQTGQVSSQATYVTADVAYSSAFQTTVKTLASGQIDPQYVGYVSPSNGVILRGYVQVDQSGNIVTASSRISLEIRDEYTSQTNTSGSSIPAITMTIPAHSGRAYNGQFDLLFRDDVGEVRIVGTFPTTGGSGVMTGGVYFANYRKFDGSSAGMSQHVGLGSFSIATCGFFACQ